MESEVSQSVNIIKNISLSLTENKLEIMLFKGLQARPKFLIQVRNLITLKDLKVARWVENVCLGRTL
jgi:hypothetical protein